MQLFFIFVSLLLIFCLTWLFFSFLKLYHFRQMSLQTFTELLEIIELRNDALPLLFERLKSHISAKQFSEMIEWRKKEMLRIAKTLPVLNISEQDFFRFWQQYENIISKDPALSHLRSLISNIETYVKYYNDFVDRYNARIFDKRCKIIVFLASYKPLSLIDYAR